VGVTAGAAPWMSTTAPFPNCRYSHSASLSRSPIHPVVWS